MVINSPALTANHLSIRPTFSLVAARLARRMSTAFALLCLLGGAVCAQASGDPLPDDKPPLVVEGVTDGNVYGFGRSIKIIGTLKEGAVAFGGDVIVQGTVEGDVAAIGGSVIQLEGARIGGDVIVVGGGYHHADKTPNRNKTNNDVIYAGYEQELRNTMRTPAGLLAPRWSAPFLGLRVLVILFWFVVSMGLTAAMPGAVSRGVARLQLTSLRVAAIGFVGALVVGAVVAACLRLLPATFGALVGMMASLFFLVSYVFGRVVIYAATGRWLQRKYLRSSGNSEAVALLIGTVIWAILSSLPYVWPFVVALTVVLSLGLALTASRRNGWKKVPAQ